MNLQKLNIIAFIFMIFTINIFGQDKKNVTILGQFRGQGNLVSYDFVGDTAYLLIGDYLEIIDFSIPGKPQKIGEYYTTPTQIQIIGNYAYTSNGSGGMHILDISNPANTRGVNTFIPSVTKSSQGFYINEQYAIMRQIISYTSSGFVIANLSDQKNPVEKGYYELPIYSENTYLNMIGNFVYLTEIRYYEGANNYWGGDLFVINISDPTNPKEVYTQRGDFRSSFISGNKLFILDNFEKIAIFDITKPSEPDSILTYDVGKTISSFAVSDNKIYVATVDSILSIVDISDTSNIGIVNTYKSSFPITGVSISGKNLFLTGSRIVKLLNINDVNNILEESTYNIAPSITILDIAVRNNLAFIASNNGFFVVDVISKSNPILLSSLYGISGRKIVLDSNYAYLARESHDLSILDLKNPLAPKVIGSYDGAGYGNNIFVKGNYAFLAIGGTGSLVSNDEKNGMVILDINSKTNPRELSYFKTDAAAHGIYVDSIYAYIGTGVPPYSGPNPNAGLYIVDISDPAQPKLLSHDKSFGQISGIKVLNNHAFISKFRGNFNILDVSDPSYPKFISADVSPTYSYDLDVENNFIYLASEYAGLTIYDYSDITDPKQVGFYNSPGRTFGVSVQNNIAYMADFNTGMFIIQNNFIFIDTLEYFSIQTYSDTALITWKIKSSAMDSVFEINRNGKTIALINSFQPAKTIHEYSYRDFNLSNGTYDYRLFQVLSNGAKFELGNSTVKINYVDTTKVDTTILVKEFNLSQNYPNPFNPNTTIEYSIKDAGFVSLTVYDVLGREVSTLVNEFENNGNYKVSFNGKGLPSGIYFYRLKSNGNSSTKKLVLLR